MTTAQANEAETMPVRITPRAARRIGELLAREGGAVMLRIAVTGGGCSGFQYSFNFDTACGADDRVIEAEGVRVVIDEVSLPFLAGAEVDYVEDLIGASFQVRNPNATAACGCGTSFSI